MNEVNGSVSQGGNDVKIARWVATIAGLLGFVLAVATPILPVVADDGDTELAAVSSRMSRPR